jgi:hypothetical protein
MRLVLLLSFALVLLLPRVALADKVAVLPFTSAGQATSQELDLAREATRAAVRQKGHTLPTDSEMLSAQMSTKDGVADTSLEYRAAGRASGSQWTVAGRVDPRGGPYGLELEVCQVDSGRVESLTREIDPPEATQQIGEMLAILLRPEGIANADIPWERMVKKPPTQPVPPTPPPGPPPPPPKPAVRHAYAENRPVALGAGGAVLAAVVRPGNARGPSTAGLVEASGGYALAQVPGLELRGDFALAVAGPGSVSFDAGARYAVPVAPTVRLFAGPEAAVGAFFPTGGDRSARFLARGSAFVALGIGEQAQLELAGDAAVAPGGSGTLVLVGGTLRALVRF